MDCEGTEESSMLVDGENQMKRESQGGEGSDSPPSQDTEPVIKDDIRAGRAFHARHMVRTLPQTSGAVNTILGKKCCPLNPPYNHRDQCFKSGRSVMEQDAKPRLLQAIQAPQVLQVQQDPPDPLATLKQVNPAPQVVMENQEALEPLVREVHLVQLEQWVPEVHLVHMEHLVLLEFLLLENLDQVASLGKLDQEENLEKEALEFLGFRDHQVQLDQWAQLECLANLELAYLVPLAILENLARVACQEEMVLLGQWVFQDQRVTLGLQAQEHLENQARMVPQVCLDLWVQKVHRVQLVSRDPLVCQVLAKRVNLEYQVAEEPPVLQEPLARKVSQAQLVILVSQVLLVLSAQLVHRVQEDSRVSQVSLGQ
ncbi:hypothetical protein FQN60_015792 [Etheostoma spectabile]|uniref:Uncharacterized protein n=1 Tax=Etheostoma spectabile TaxID=54343 RepID=A0A5J5CRK6_9PERO|nr:hypothetical protein FQN60_015792 [Etheostoma spectabile]